MAITTTQKIIKIGTSTGVTIPAKELRNLGAQVGDELQVTFALAPKKTDDEKVELVALTQTLIKRHEQAMKNLSQR